MWAWEPMKECWRSGRPSDGGEEGDAFITFLHNQLPDAWKAVWAGQEAVRANPSSTKTEMCQEGSSKH